MRTLTIYIASSWKNQHAVEMLTERLRASGHIVLSWVENNHGEDQAKVSDEPFERWVDSERGRRAFVYDTDGATKSDLVIYVGPSGCDAWAEVGAAWAARRPILGLWGKGEPVGLMRRMMQGWAHDYRRLLHWVDLMAAEGAGDIEAANVRAQGGAG